MKIRTMTDEERGYSMKDKKIKENKKTAELESEVLEQVSGGAVKIINGVEYPRYDEFDGNDTTTYGDGSVNA